MERPAQPLADEAWAEYVAYLEKCLNGSSDLIRELNQCSSVLADDLRKIRTGEQVVWEAEGDTDVPKSGLIFLSGDAKDKTFERTMILFDKIDKIKALAVITMEQPGKDKPKMNIQDFALKKA